MMRGWKKYLPGIKIGKDRSHGTQPGDPDKGAELIIKATEREDTPFRLLLGSDAVTYANEVMERRRQEYGNVGSIRRF